MHAAGRPGKEAEEGRGGEVEGPLQEEVAQAEERLHPGPARAGVRARPRGGQGHGGRHRGRGAPQEHGLVRQGHKGKKITQPKIHLSD